MGKEVDSKKKMKSHGKSEMNDQYLDIPEVK